MEILFILEKSWFNYIGDQRKGSKMKHPDVTLRVNGFIGKTSIKFEMCFH